MKTEKKLKLLFQKANSQILIRRPDNFRLFRSDENFNYIQGRSRIFINLLLYMDKKIWAADLLINLLFMIFLVFLESLGAGTDDITVFLMLASSVLGSASILILSHLFGGGLAELSSTCFFNTRQLAAFQMLGLGSVNLASLAFLTLFTGSRWETEIFRVGIYTAVPFVFTVTVCIGILQARFFHSRSYPVPAAGAFCASASLVLASVPHFYQPSAFLFWCIGLVAELFMLAVQIGRLLAAIDKGEILCTV